MQDLLMLLSDNEFHSGEQLGKSLGVTRAAIWKKLQKLEQMGVTLHSVKGRGYRLPKALELLSLDKMKSIGLSVPAEILFKVESTNVYVKRLIQDGQVLPVVVAAEMQTKGRGRRGRQWQGGLGRNIMMSFGFHFNQGVSVVEGLSLAVGVAVARVLMGQGVKNVGLKWPNDVLIDNKKVCGILLEMVADQDSCDIVVGLGLNVSLSVGDMVDVEQPWTDLSAELGFIPKRNEILVGLVDEIENVCRRFSEGDGLSVYADEWLQRDILKDQAIQVLTGNNEIFGFARGIDSSGSLLLERDGIIHALHGGEVSVRKR